MVIGMASLADNFECRLNRFRLKDGYAMKGGAMPGKSATIPAVTYCSFWSLFSYHRHMPPTPTLMPPARA